MKKLGLTLVAALAFSAATYAQTDRTDAQKWDGNIDKSKLSNYLKLTPKQNREVADICDYFREEMGKANSAKTNADEKVRNAVYGNLKLMKQTLNEKQYSDYLRLMAMTLQNRGIDIEKK